MLTQQDIARRARVALILRAQPRDGDGDGFYDPDGKGPRRDRTPVPPKVPKPSPPPGRKATAKKPSPTTAAAAKYHRSLAEFGDLIRHRDSGEKKRHRLSEGKMGKTYLVDHNDGSSTIEKVMRDVSNTVGAGVGDPERQADAEQLASLLGQAIGAPVPKVLRAADDTVSIELVDGDSWSAIEQQTPNPTSMDIATLTAVREALVATPEGIRLGLLDLLLANWDRASNGSNWMVGDDSRPHGLDHAVVWADADYDDGPDTAPPGWALSIFAVAFVTPPTADQRRWSPNGNPPLQWIDNPLTAADVDWLRARLAELEDDFDRLGRHDWWEFAVARLEVLAQHATGSEGVFT